MQKCCGRSTDALQKREKGYVEYAGADKLLTEPLNSNSVTITVERILPREKRKGYAKCITK